MQYPDPAPALAPLARGQTLTRAFAAGDELFCASGTLQLNTSALAGIEATRFYPAWGKARLYAMIANRPDWTLSRQRQWGTPMRAYIRRR